MVAKQVCPYCSKEFVNLSRHKCKLKQTNPSSSKKKKPTKSKKSPSNSQKKSQVSAILDEKKQKASSKRKGYSEIDKEVFGVIKQKKSTFFDEIVDFFSKDETLDEKTLEKSLYRLEAKQKISMISDVKEGFRKIRVDYIEDYEIKNKSALKNKADLSSWEILDDCPCFLCPEIIKCNVGNSSFMDASIDKNTTVNTNPFFCEYLESWLNCRINEPPLEYKSPFKGGAYLDKKKKKKAKAEAKA